MNFRRRLKPMPNQQKPVRMLAPAQGKVLLCLWTLAGGAVIVSWLVAAPSCGVTVQDERLHVTPAGIPEYAIVIAWLKPLAGVKVSITFPLWPRATVRVL